MSEQSAAQSFHPQCCPIMVYVALEDAGLGYDRLWRYRVPAAFAEQVQPGMRAAVPFGGGNRRRVGMILRTDPPSEEAAEFVGKTKPLLTLLDGSPVLSGELLHLVDFLHEHTFCTWYDAVRAVLPGGMSVRLEYQYIPVSDPPDVPLTDEEADILSRLRGTKTGAERAAILEMCAVPDSIGAEALKGLTEKGFVEQAPYGKFAVSDSTEKMIRLSNEFIRLPQGFQPTQAQRRAVAQLAEHGALSVKECAYLAGIAESTVRKLISQGIAEVFEKELLHVPRDAAVTINPADTVLSPQQQAAYEQAAQAIAEQKAAAFLLYGVTGSGKTAVFEQLIALTLHMHRSVLLLVPEISLTPQIVNYFQARFGNLVGVKMFAQT